MISLDSDQPQAYLFSLDASVAPFLFLRHVRAAHEVGLQVGAPVFSGVGSDLLRFASSLQPSLHNQPLAVSGAPCCLFFIQSPVGKI
jgi:hypothetical protein